jgi:hypothetical protein
MFVPNIQPQLLGFETELNQKLRDALISSKEKWFYDLVFANINKFDFRVLYSDQASRPNTPVKVLVSAIILK